MMVGYIVKRMLREHLFAIIKEIVKSWQQMKQEAVDF